MLLFRRTGSRMELKLIPDYSLINVYETSNHPLKTQENRKEPNASKGLVSGQRKISQVRYLGSKDTKTPYIKGPISPTRRLHRRPQRRLLFPGKHMPFQDVYTLKTILLRVFYQFYHCIFMLYKLLNTQSLNDHGQVTGSLPVCFCLSWGRWRSQCIQRPYGCCEL